MRDEGPRRPGSSALCFEGCTPRTEVAHPEALARSRSGGPVIDLVAVGDQSPDLPHDLGIVRVDLTGSTLGQLMSIPSGATCSRLRRV
jgi:hypothetical protein